MAKTSGGVRNSVFKNGRQVIRLVDTENRKNVFGDAYKGTIMKNNKGYSASIVGGGKYEHFDSRTERQVLSWMKKRGFVPK